MGNGLLSGKRVSRPAGFVHESHHIVGNEAPAQCPTSALDEARLDKDTTFSRQRCPVLDESPSLAPSLSRNVLRSAVYVQNL